MKKAIQRLLSFLGIKIVRIGQDNSEKPVINVSTGALLDHDTIDDTYFTVAATGKEVFGSNGFADDIPMLTMHQAVKYVLRNEINGDIVECGVGNGGKMFMAAWLCQHSGEKEREMYLYDTFAGMTEPGERDYKIKKGRKLSSQRAMKEFYNASKTDSGSTWCCTPLRDVEDNMAKTGYMQSLCHYVEGDVLKTIPSIRPTHIAVLRLDTDFYDSTMHELSHLYDLVVPGGVIIFDDYGGWNGQKTAVDEFFAGIGIQPLLVRTCWKERVYVKMQ